MPMCFISPFFDKAVIKLPVNGQTKSTTLTVSSPNAPTSPYIRSVSLNGRSISTAKLDHDAVVGGGTLVFAMNDKPQSWPDGGEDSGETEERVKDL